MQPTAGAEDGRHGALENMKLRADGGIGADDVGEGGAEALESGARRIQVAVVGQRGERSERAGLAGRQVIKVGVKLGLQCRQQFLVS